MARETDPQDYQFRHEQRISMPYGGIASGSMELQDPTADGFMRVTDMRRNIVITQRGQSRTYDYDQVGPVRVAKILEIPRVGRGEGGILHTHKEEDNWLIEIDDQKLWKEISQGEGNFQQREDQFVDRFRGEVLTGITKSLFEEKLFNGGVYSPATTIGAVSLLVCYLMPAMTEIVTIALGKHTLDLVLKNIIFISTAHLALNMLSWCSSIVNEKQGRLFDHPAINWVRVLPHYQEPWVRHAFPEFLMPPIPVDRLVRGSVYLKSHGEDLIQRN